MTTQEYVKKEAEKHLEKVPNGMVNGQLLVRSYASGLSAGIELAKEFAEWIEDNGFIKLNNGSWTEPMGFIIKAKTTSELFEIFLTERNEK